MCRMHNPVHAGECQLEWIPEIMILTGEAKKLQVSCVTLYKVPNGCSCQLDWAPPDFWPGMQTQWALWQAEQLPKPDIKPKERLTA